MNIRKNQAEVYLAIALGAFGFSIQTPDWPGLVLLVLAILSALCFLFIAFTSRFKWRWLVQIADRLVEVCFGHLTLFLGLSGLAVSLAQKGNSYLSIAVFVVAYAILLWGFIPRRTSE